MNSEILRLKIIESLKSQGFSVNEIVEPKFITKDSLKSLQDSSRREQINIHRDFILSNEKKIKNYIVNGKDINPLLIELELREVKENTIEEIIFRWWNLVWWSVPYQRAYGRQMRFILWDKTHNAPFGLIGLQSPILKMAIRDKYLKIPKPELDEWINKSLHAQRLGALPPYNLILGGKMVALALATKEIKDAYEMKYSNKETLLEKRIIKPELLFITTTSAFGRSSIYNRLKYRNIIIAQSLGYTKGSGTFHISQGIYKEIVNYLEEMGINTRTTFGNGPSRKLKILNIAFTKLGLIDYTYHNIKREFFLFPLATNLTEIIHNNQSPNYSVFDLNELLDYWKKRWCIPRTYRFNDWKDFDSIQYIDNFLNKLKNEKTKKKEDNNVKF